MGWVFEFLGSWEVMGSNIAFLVMCRLSMFETSRVPKQARRRSADSQKSDHLRCGDIPEPPNHLLVY